MRTAIAVVLLAGCGGNPIDGDNDVETDAGDVPTRAELFAETSCSADWIGAPEKCHVPCADYSALGLEPYPSQCVEFFGFDPYPSTPTNVLTCDPFDPNVEGTLVVWRGVIGCCLLREADGVQPERVVFTECVQE